MKKQQVASSKKDVKGVKKGGKPVAAEVKVSKKGVAPIQVEALASCVCGESFKIMSTKSKLAVGICYKCHPFYTGKQKFVDTAGRIEKFMSKFGNKPEYSKSENLNKK